MSLKTAADVSKEINEVDQAVRVALAEGNIVEKMRELTPRIKGLFATKKASNAGQGIGSQEIRAAFSARAFLWDFAIAWAKDKASDPDFVNTQRTKLAAFDGPSAALPSATSASGSRITKPAPASPTPGPLVSQQALQVHVQVPLPDLPRPNAAASAQPGPAAQTDADADTSLALRRGKRSAAAEAAKNFGQPPASDNLPEGLPKPTNDESEKVPPRQAPQPPKRRRIPVKGSLNDVPCVRCLAHSLECYGQSGRGRGACWNCGKSKLKCSLKRSTPMDEDDPTAGSATANADPKPKPKPRPRAGRKLKGPKAKTTKSPATVPESEDETPAAEELPAPAESAGPSALSGPPSLSASAKPRQESPPRFTALEKGKGREGTMVAPGDTTASESDADKIEVPLDLQVAGLTTKVAELEDTVERLNQTVRQLAKVVTTAMTALELKDNDYQKLEDDIRVIKEHFGLADIQHIQLWDGLQPELVTNMRGFKRVHTITNPYHDQPPIPFEVEVRHVPHPANMAAAAANELPEGDHSDSASGTDVAAASKVNIGQAQSASASGSEQVTATRDGIQSASASALLPTFIPAAEPTSESSATPVAEDTQAVALPNVSHDPPVTIDLNPPPATAVVDDAASMPPPNSQMPPPPVDLIPPTPQNSQEAATYEITTLVPSTAAVVSADERQGQSATSGSAAEAEAESASKTTAVEADIMAVGNIPSPSHTHAEAAGDAVADVSASARTAEVVAEAAAVISTAMDIVQPIPRAAQLLTPSFPLATTEAIERRPSPARSRARLSPIPPDQIRRSPRLQSRSPGPSHGSAPTTPSASGPAITRGQSALKRPSADDLEEGPSNKRPREN